jgi:hypothetical protein
MKHDRTGIVTNGQTLTFAAWKDLGKSIGAARRLAVAPPGDDAALAHFYTETSPPVYVVA